ncbi:phosphoinositide 3-kinase regulatory subunit 4 [Oryx dammah]|uniref:phosphoinositide 3-kinase regulatory subunit 4 n=1 Tax=Oryx dammah TaxID=59534 RepID=UPI001A9B0B3F|nr:phosphoinositide 3-kinase regulatory subunit 4 [Oryx dammah]
MVIIIINFLPFIENIALLAETALRFLELVQLKNLNMENDPNSEEIDEVTHSNGNYDTELQALHEMVQQKVVTLLSDPENIVKQTLTENGITRLCVFFGRQEASDVLLSHMITFLNDKNDRHLRGAFFDSMVGVAAYVGWQSSSILKPLLQQGLSDAEEFVIVKALNALPCMCQLGLLQKPHVYEFASDIAPFLCHPHRQTRCGAVGFITVVAHQLSTADVYCKLMPYLDPYITQPVIQVEAIVSDVVQEDCICKLKLKTHSWFSSGWRPKGLLVAHLHEHKSAVNRIRVSDEHSLFATCSNDGTVKIWNSQKMEGKTTTTRSILTYSRIGGRVKTLTFCQGSHYLAIASDNGAVQLLAIEASKLPKSPKIHPLQSRVLDQKEDGCVVDLHHFSSGAQSVLAYATVNGALVGWDLRSSSNAWTLRHDLKAGLITSFAVDIHQCWLCIGTSSGTMACWDMRFQLPISSHCHPSRARVRRLSMHPLYQSWVIAAVQGNNEVSMWDMETGDRRFTLWASSAPPLSELQFPKFTGVCFCGCSGCQPHKPSSHSVHGLYCSPADGNPILLTAGSDMKIRFWDLAYPERSYVVAGSTGSPSVSYYRKVIEGTEVVQEIQNKQKVGPSDDGPRRGPESLPVGHHDIITDVATFQTTQGFIVTASRDGIVKVWK